MAIGVLILGEPGTGKTYGIKGFDADEVKVISLFKPILPFKGKYEVVRVERTSDAIIEELKKQQSYNIKDVAKLKHEIQQLAVHWLGCQNIAVYIDIP